MDKVSIYIPDSDNIGKGIIPPMFDEIVKTVCIEITELFGGCSVDTVKGYYLNEDNHFIEENTKIVYCYIQDIQEYDEDWIVAVCDYIKDMLQQENVLYTVESVKGKMVFI